MTDWKKSLRALTAPKTGQVWYVKEESLRWITDNPAARVQHPVIVLMNPELLNQFTEKSVVLIVPISTSGGSGKTHFPVGQAYQNVADEFKVSPRATAVLSHYQPISSEHLDSPIAEIESVSLNALRNQLCCDIIGADEYGFDLSAN